MAKDNANRHYVGVKHDTKLKEMAHHKRMKTPDLLREIIDDAYLKFLAQSDTPTPPSLTLKLEELQQKINNLEELQQKITELEERVEDLED